MGRASKRDTVLDTAEVLFERQGFVATGVSQITDDAGIAPMTLYNNFDTKDDLILSVLTRRSDRFIETITHKMEKAGDDPIARIRSIFMAIDQWIRTEMKSPDGFAGCTFIKAAIEFSASSHPAHEAARDHKKELIALFATNVKAAGFSNPKELALSLHLLADGAIAQAQMLNDPRSVKRALSIAETLLERSDK